MHSQNLFLSVSTYISIFSVNRNGSKNLRDQKRMLHNIYSNFPNEFLNYITLLLNKSYFCHSWTLNWRHKVIYILENVWFGKSSDIVLLEVAEYIDYSLDVSIILFISNLITICSHLINTCSVTNGGDKNKDNSW